jgi:predicted Holliday junction resolvase-like endonuclease
LFEPVDYLIFSGLTGRRKVDALYFVDVKSGAARLTAKQRIIKEVVDAGRVKFKLTKVED